MRTKILKVAVLEKPQVIWGLPSGTPPGCHSENQRSPPCSPRGLKISIVKYAQSVFHNKCLFCRGKHIAEESYPMWRNSYQANPSQLPKSGEEAVPMEKHLSRDTRQQKTQI